MQDDTEKQYEESIKHAEKLGVSVEIEGELCDEYQVALITDKAIRECVTNCIRHAHGRRVYVQSHKTREGWKVCITNDGERPKEGVQRRRWTFCFARSCRERRRRNDNKNLSRSFCWL